MHRNRVFIPFLFPERKFNQSLHEFLILIQTMCQADEKDLTIVNGADEIPFRILCRFAFCIIQSFANAEGET